MSKYQNRWFSSRQTSNTTMMRIHEYKELLSIHLQQQRGLRFNELVHLSNGCSSQYKSKGPLADIAHSSEDYDFKISHHYYGSRHGKGASDGESAVVKSNASNAIRCGSLITNARDLYDHCQENLVRDTSTHWRRMSLFSQQLLLHRECFAETSKNEH